MIDNFCYFVFYFNIKKPFSKGTCYFKHCMLLFTEPNFTQCQLDIKVTPSYFYTKDLYIYFVPYNYPKSSKAQENYNLPLKLRGCNIFVIALVKI